MSTLLHMNFVLSNLLDFLTVLKVCWQTIWYFMCKQSHYPHSTRGLSLFNKILQHAGPRASLLFPAWAFCPETALFLWHLRQQETHLEMWASLCDRNNLGACENVCKNTYHGAGFLRDAVNVRSFLPSFAHPREMLSVTTYGKFRISNRVRSRDGNLQNSEK